MPEPCKFSSLDSRRKRFLCTHKEVDLALHQVIGLVLQVGDMEKKFPHALGFESLDPFFRVSKQGLCFTAIEENGGGKRLRELELACIAVSESNEKSSTSTIMTSICCTHLHGQTLLRFVSINIFLHCTFRVTFCTVPAESRE